jgi:hypothetical protein
MWVPDDAFAALRKVPAESAQTLAVGAAVKWYEMGEVSQGQAAGIVRMGCDRSLSIFEQAPQASTGLSIGRLVFLHSHDKCGSGDLIPRLPVIILVKNIVSRWVSKQIC